MTGTEVVAQIIVPALLAALTLVMGALLKTYRDEQTRQATALMNIEARHDKGLDALQDKHAALAKELARDYVRHDEFVRQMVSMDRKLDGLSELLGRRFDELDDKVDKLPCKGGTCELG